MHKIIPRAQDYPWGSTRWIPEFLGLPAPDEKPWAELWYGAHPRAPSLLEEKGIDLLQWISRDPELILGSKVVNTFGPQLPFLLKLLAAAEPLSIQCHPSLLQAQEGFQRENQLGIPLDSPFRNYKDPNHKPEIILALSPFTALCGFRSPSSILHQFKRVVPILPGLTAFFPLLERANIDEFFRSLFTLPRDTIRSWIHTYRTHLREKPDHSTPEDRWFSLLSSLYPEDPGCFSPYYLNLVELSPGEALYLDSGVLHAYLHGFGIELMANSDNVLRGGLTSKYVDLEELLKVGRFKEEIPRVIRPERKRIPLVGGELWEELYPVLIMEFHLSIFRIHEVKDQILLPVSGPAILLCGEGVWELKGESGYKPILLKRGEGCFLDATLSKIQLSGKKAGSESGWIVQARVGFDG